MNTTLRTIAFVTPYFPPHTGGVERYVYEIAKQFNGMSGYRVVVITSGAKSRHDVKEVYDGLVVYRLGYRLKVSNTPLSLRWPGAVRKILNEEKPDIVNVHLPVPGLGDLTSFLVEKEKLIVTYHAQSMRKGKFLPDIVVWLYEHLVLPRVLERARHVVCSSDTVRNEFLSAYMHKSSTIPPAVDTARFGREEGKRPAHTMLFVASELSRACEYKGLSLLIESLKEIHDRGVPARLMVVGEGDMRPHYEARVRELGLQDAVEFKGRLYGEELRRAYTGATVFVLPTSNDSYPTVILEAMLSGLPVVSTTVGDIPIMVKDGTHGYLVPPGDQALLTEKLLALLTNPGDVARMGAAAREKIMHGYSWEERATRYEAFFTTQLRPERLIVHCLGYYPPHLGGMEQRVQELVTLLAKRGEKVVVLTSNIGTRAKKEIQQGVEVRYLRAFEFAHTPIAPGILFHLLTLPKNSVLHLHVAQAFYPEIVALVARLRGLPYVAHIRLLLDIPSGFFGKLLPYYSKFILGPVLRGAHRVIILTPCYKEILKTRYRIPVEKLVIIPNATTFSRVAVPRSTLHTPLRILAVGRISVQKNYPLMLRVAAHLKKEYGLNFTLTIVGAGLSLNDMEAEVRTLGIEREVRFVGDVRGEPLQTIYEESDLLLHTALVEGFGTVFIEAFAKGLPIVASKVLGITDVVFHERNGLLAELSVADMSRAVMRLVNNPDLYAAISANNLTDVEMYNWDTITNHTLAVYNELLS